MGFFSWMFADRNNEQALKIGKKHIFLFRQKKIDTMKIFMMDMET